MKTTLITLLLTLNLSSALACTCSAPEFTELDRQDAIEQFMTSKNSIEARDLISISTYDRKLFVGPAVKAILALEKRLEDQSFYQCDSACAHSMNEKAKHIVTYQVDEMTCQLELTTKMKSNILSQGFKSTVKQKLRPTCK